MELRHLRYFVGIAEAGGFSAAARRLRVAQPALSRQIRALEEEIGVVLLSRDAKGVKLTDAGLSFLPEARAILERSERAVRFARLGRSLPAVELQVGWVWGLFHSLVPACLARFRAAHPEVAVHLFDWNVARQAEAIEQGRLDAGFIGLAEDAAAAGLTCRTVGRCALQVVLPRTHAAARQRRIGLATLADESFLAISDEQYPGAARLAREACRRAGFRPRISQTAERGHGLLALVASTPCVALLPEPLAALPHPGVVFRPLAAPIESDLCLAWNGSRPNPVRDAFLASVEEIALPGKDP